MLRNLGSTTDRIPAFMVWIAAGLVTGILVALLGNILWQGSSHLSWEFLTSVPMNAGREGGIGPILVSTLLIIAVCMTFALPIGLGSGVFLAEFTKTNNVFAHITRRSLDVLAGIPSIVFGLFGNALFCQLLGFGFSILSGGLTLACMVLPILIRTTEEGFRLVSRDHHFAAAALGLSKTSTLNHVLIPLALPSLLVGFILGLGRAIAETAALIFTSGYVDRMPESLLDSGRSLSIHIFDLSMNVPGGNQHAYATAVVLIGTLLILNSLTTWITNQWVQRRTMAA